MATNRKLGRETSHRNLKLRNLVTDLLRNGRIDKASRKKTIYLIRVYTNPNTVRQ